MKKKNFISIFILGFILLILIGCTRKNNTEFTKSVTVETLDNIAYNSSEESTRLETKSFEVRDVVEPEIIGEINRSQSKEVRDLEITLIKGFFKMYTLNKEAKLPEDFPKLEDDEEYKVYEIKYLFNILNPKNIENLEEKISFSLNSDVNIYSEEIEFIDKDNESISGEVTFLSNNIKKSDIGDLVFHFDEKVLEMDYKF